MYVVPSMFFLWGHKNLSKEGTYIFYSKSIFSIKGFLRRNSYKNKKYEFFIKKNVKQSS